MAEFKTVAQLVQLRESARVLFSALLGLWGGAGLLTLSFEVMDTNTMSNVGVGQSTYVMMHLMWYLCGTVFFGLCALVSNGRLEFQRLEESVPAETAEPTKPIFKDG